MKLTLKDKDFLERLRLLLEEEGVWIELKADPLKRLVLRRNYGSRIECLFRLTRQGVRWRFQRLADMYVSAYETILFVESNLGTDLRPKAMAIARERAELRRNAQKATGGTFLRREEARKAED